MTKNANIYFYIKYQIIFKGKKVKSINLTFKDHPKACRRLRSSH